MKAIDERLGQHIVNSLLIDGYAEEHLDEIDQFFHLVGATPEMEDLLTNAPVALLMQRMEREQTLSKTLDRKVPLA